MSVPLAYKFEQYTQEKSHAINFTHEVLLLSQQFIDALQNAQRGQRGYLLTQNVDYLDPYYKGIKNAYIYYNTLYKKTLHNKAQTQKLQKIEQLMKVNLAVYKETIDIAQKESFDKAITVVRKNRGKKSMDAIKHIMLEYINEEQRLLEVRKGEFLAHRSQIMAFLLGSLGFFIIIAIFTYLFLEKTLFLPMKTLLENTHKIQNGERIHIRDILPEDEMGFLLASFYDMHDKVIQREKKLKHAATHDVLTGLPNRLNLQNDIQNALKKNDKKESSIAVLFIDVNKFKCINDTYGHKAGDAVLQDVATRLQNVLRSSDRVFRLGGDEFIILIEDVTKVKIIEKVLEHILDAMKKYITYETQKLDISLSIGIALSPQDTTNPDELIKYADIAMYEAKKDEKVEYKFFDSSMLKRSND